MKSRLRCGFAVLLCACLCAPGFSAQSNPHATSFPATSGPPANYPVQEGFIDARGVLIYYMIVVAAHR